ncbi:MAG: hypothetical protein JST23_07495 [Bacteroidetes bacterium]|nr:hypothetical protein [Bacteroidota bacterium]
MKKLFFLLIIIVAFTACTNYGSKEKSGSVEVFYKEGINKEQAKKTADLFYESLKAANQDLNKKRSFQIFKGGGDTINLKMVVEKEKLSQAKDDILYPISNLVSDSVFGGKPVNLILTDNAFKVLRTLVYKKPVTEQPVDKNSLAKATSGYIEVYYTQDMGATTAQNLADYINKKMGAESTISYGFTKGDDGNYLIKMVTKTGYAQTATYDQWLEVMKDISTDVLQGSPLSFELTDENFNALKTFEYPKK